MRKGVQVVALALVTLALVPAGAAAAEACPRGNHAAIAVYAPRLVQTGGELTVELEGEAVVADAYRNVVVTVGGVATPVALAGYGTEFVTVRAPARSGPFEVTVGWDQSADANGAESGGVACSGTTAVEVLAARWSGRSGTSSCRGRRGAGGVCGPCRGSGAARRSSSGSRPSAAAVRRPDAGRRPARRDAAQGPGHVLDRRPARAGLELQVSRPLDHADGGAPLSCSRLG